jgi:hypothetical protein
MTFTRQPRSRIESVEVKLGKRVVKDVIRGDLLEVEVDLEAEGLAWPDNEWVGLFRGYRDFPADLEEPRLEYGKFALRGSRRGSAEGVVSDQGARCRHEPVLR